MADEYKVQFIVPTYNCQDLIDDTLQSIWRQTYNSDLIYTTVMDFESVDGTYEMLLGYNSKNLGVYKYDKPYDQRLYISIIVNLLERLYGERKDYYYVVLLPGEVVYSDFVKKCIDAFKKENGIEAVLCESDIKYRSRLISQEPLFSHDQILAGNNEEYCLAYMKMGARHQIHSMVRTLQKFENRASGEINEGRWWNKLGKEYKFTKTYYINEPLVCQNPIMYSDELEEVLLRWESLIYQKRIDETVGIINNNKEEYYKEAIQRLIEYTTWRGYFLKDINDKQANDCLKIAEVIKGIYSL